MYLYTTYFMRFFHERRLEVKVLLKNSRHTAERMIDLFPNLIVFVIKSVNSKLSSWRNKINLVFFFAFVQDIFLNVVENNYLRPQLLTWSFKVVIQWRCRRTIYCLGNIRFTFIRNLRRTHRFPVSLPEQDTLSWARSFSLFSKNINMDSYVL